MNQEIMMKAMKTSISEVLEQMFFLPIDVDDAEQNGMMEGEKELIVASVLFEGKPSGRFVLSMPVALAISICADFLGEKKDTITKDHVNGTVKEMINMLAGNTLMSFDQQALFDLQIPYILESYQLNSIPNEYRQHLSMGIKTLESRMTLTVMS